MYQQTGVETKGERLHFRRKGFSQKDLELLILGKKPDRAQGEAKKPCWSNPSVQEVRVVANPS